MADARSNPPPPLWLDAASASPLFDSPLNVMSARTEVVRGASAAILVGVGAPGDADDSAFDILLTTTPNAPRPWVSLPKAILAVVIECLERRAKANPLAASACAQVLRIGASLSFDDALALESFAYSALLGGAEFRAWRTAVPRQNRAPRPGAVRVARDGDRKTLVLARPARRNAIDAALRDALCEHLSLIRDDASLRAAELRGDGQDFCAGGDLDEFGTAEDLAAAHFIRTLQSPARLAQECGDRLTAYVHGACIGAGFEMAAACARVIADPAASFRLPEVAMGLIPGAGGTASVPRRIGRHRACYLALSGAALDAATALAWGLVDRMEQVS